MSSSKISNKGHSRERKVQQNALDNRNTTDTSKMIMIME